MTVSNSSTTKVIPVDWYDQQKSLTAIRTEVFVEEQNCPPEEEWDEFDRSSKHFIAYEGDKVLGCGRLMASGQVGRMAVLKHARGMGVGGSILACIIKYARSNNIDHIKLNAQSHAIDFYRRFGFEAQGETFMEVGIEHQTMVLKALS
ncbi:Acetyltransferase [Sinobacterium norvegicum]|uniref:Acetyltransferase n=1 Tax=Sinobacterium norvegicum TaxID=1641715 RepID=A0ABM9AB03_9GAMM|nr:GNAT family N-acetyltransferase [Sinobacterium norvegicum]CAH0990334.1 Acetyltransferase [Sinobacterium norvegicum]